VNRWSTWRDGLPLGVFFPAIFVVWTGVRLGLAAGGGDRITTALVAFEVIGGLIFTGIMTALLAWRRRRSGGKSVYTAMNTAVRTGRLQEDAEPSLWAPERERRRRSFSRARVANPIVCVRSLDRVESLQGQLDARGAAPVASFESRQP